jgi:hypothetical protein
MRCRVSERLPNLGQSDKSHSDMGRRPGEEDVLLPGLGFGCSFEGCKRLVFDVHGMTIEEALVTAMWTEEDRGGGCRG